MRVSIVVPSRGLLRTLLQNRRFIVSLSHQELGGVLGPGLSTSSPYPLLHSRGRRSLHFDLYSHRTQLGWDSHCHSYHRDVSLMVHPGSSNGRVERHLVFHGRGRFEPVECDRRLR